MSMTDPTILQLLEKADCRYTLVVETSKRARQLIAGLPTLIDAKDAPAAKAGHRRFCCDDAECMSFCRSADV